MELHRVVVTWQGPSVVGNAVTVLHFAGDNPLTDVSAITSAFQKLSQFIAGKVTMTVPNTGDTIEDTTGHLTGTWSATGGGQVLGTDSGLAAAGVGGVVTWQTGGIVNGKKGPRRLRGRTFVVPASLDAYDQGGVLTSLAMSQLENFATGLQAAGPLAIWHRPTTKGGVDGNSYGVLSHRIHNKVAFLSSRRD